jgi:hypothetical protein
VTTVNGVAALTAGTIRDPPVLVLSRCSRPDSGLACYRQAKAQPGVLPRLAICPDLRIVGGEIAVQTGSGVRRSPSQGEAPNGTIAINGIQG